MASKYIKLIDEILRLKRQKNAVILAHNYQRDEIQDIADFLGDSLGLSQNAAKTDAEVIIFCGVHFMAETAAILCPEKTVLLPDIKSGCPMANMITVKKLQQKRKEFPKATVVCYVNTSAEIKAESDICCTSSNAVKVVRSLDTDEVLFIPDQYLGHYVSTHTKQKIHFWPGYCPTHAKITTEGILKLKKEYPQAKTVVHPECRPDVIEIADGVFSTSGIMRYARENSAKYIIIGTEIGIIHRLKKENPDKTFIPASTKATCPNMKRITLEKVLWALQEMEFQVTVPEDTRLKAKSAVDRMLDISRDD